MKLTITKKSGTVITKEFKDADVSEAKANGWAEVGKPKTASKKSKSKTKGDK